MLLTKEGMGAYKTLINKANYNLQLKLRPLLCARMSLDIEPLTVINAGQIIVDPSDIPTSRQYMEFLCVDDLLVISSYKRGIELQLKIDRLPFQAPPSKILSLAEEIEHAQHIQDIPGIALDLLMYQLWQRDEETIERFGYEYQDQSEAYEQPADNDTPCEDDTDVPLF